MKTRRNVHGALAAFERLRVLQRLGRVLLIVALLGATGGHWAVLQTSAWSSMLADNLQKDFFGTPISNTFGGWHPCCLNTLAIWIHNYRWDAVLVE